MKFTTIIDEQILDMEFSPSMDTMKIKEAKNVKQIDCVPLGINSYSLILNGRTYYLTMRTHLDGYEVTVDHHTHMVQVKDERELLLEEFGMQSEASRNDSDVQAPIPGLISSIFVKSGDIVETGEKLCILEAMKMENEITSPKNGTIKLINIYIGSNVEKGDLLMEISD